MTAPRLYSALSVTLRGRGEQREPQSPEGDFRRRLRRRKLRHPKLLPTQLSVPEVVLRLLVKPTLGGRAKGNRKTDRHLGANPGTAIQNGGQGLAAYSQSFRGLRHGEAEWLKAKGFDDLARMRWIMHTHR